MKHLEGKEVYLRPTGNNARGNKNGYKKATIIKVAKVNITFRIDGRNEQKSRFNGTRISENNSGYQVYETEQEAKDYFLSSELAGKIVKKYNYRSDFMQVDIEKLKKVAELLGV